MTVDESDNNLNFDEPLESAPVGPPPLPPAFEVHQANAGAGSLFRKEFRDAARDRRGFWIRVLFGLSLVLMAVSSWQTSDLALSFDQNLADSRTLFLSIFQMVGYLSITMAWIAVPWLVGSVVERERQSGALDILMTLPVPRSSILLSKLLSRVSLTLLLLLGAMPFLAIFLTAGGIEPGNVILCELLSLAIACLAGTVALYCSTRFQGNQKAIGLSLLIMAVLLGLSHAFLAPLNPYYVLYHLTEPTSTQRGWCLGFLPINLGAIAGLCLHFWRQSNYYLLEFGNVHLDDEGEEFGAAGKTLPMCLMQILKPRMNVVFYHPVALVLIGIYVLGYWGVYDEQFIPRLYFVFIWTALGILGVLAISGNPLMGRGKDWWEAFLVSPLPKSRLLWGIYVVPLRQMLLPTLAAGILTPLLLPNAGPLTVVMMILFFVSVVLFLFGVGAVLNLTDTTYESSMFTLVSSLVGILLMPLFFTTVLKLLPNVFGLILVLVGVLMVEYIAWNSRQSGLIILRLVAGFLGLQTLGVLIGVEILQPAFYQDARVDELFGLIETEYLLLIYGKGSEPIDTLLRPEVWTGMALAGLVSSTLLLVWVYRRFDWLTERAQPSPDRPGLHKKWVSSNEEE